MSDDEGRWLEGLDERTERERRDDVTDAHTLGEDVRPGLIEDAAVAAIGEPGSGNWSAEKSWHEFKAMIEMAVTTVADSLRSEGAARERARIREEVERVALYEAGMGRWEANRAVAPLLAFIDKGDEHDD